jgi:hypothetical protein
MTFSEFSKAIKKDSRLMDLLNQCDRSCNPLTDEETQELVDRAAAIMDEWEDYDWWEGN